MKKTVSGIILAFLVLSVLLLSFNIHPVGADGTIYIRADGSIDPPSAPISSVDNVSYVFTDNINGSIVVERGSIIIDGAGHTLEGQGIYGEGMGTIDLEGEGNVTVQNTKIEDFVVGILVNSSYGDTIRNNVIEGGDDGILVYSNSNYNTIAMNNLTNDDQGIDLSGSSGNSITGNWMDYNFDGGIVMVRASNNTVEDNNITNCYKIGVDVGFSSICNVINENDIAGNGIGVQLSYSSNNNTVLDNDVTVNHVAGISVGYRMPEDASSYAGVSGNIVSGNNISQNECGLEFLFSTNNKVFHNNFEANTISAKVEESPGNLLDGGCPIGGNYWSDYNGSDMFTGTYQNISGSDGIGDTSYVIDANNTDYYPLMHPWISLPVHDINTGLEYSTIQDAVNANETLNGNVILVDEGTYHEHVVLNKSLTLIGENRDNTIVDGNATGPPFTLNAENVSLINFTAANAGRAQPLQAVADSQAEWAILLNQTANCVVENMKTLDNSLVGIVLYNSNQCKISSCECFGNQSSPAEYNQQCGIVLLTSNENTISNNVVSTNFVGVTLSGYGCDNNVLAGNQISFCVDNGFDIVGLNNTVASNQIWNNTNGVLFDTASYNLVRDNDISNSTMNGIYLARYSSNNTISENTIETNQWSVFADGASGNSNLFYHNDFLRNTFPPTMPPNLLDRFDDGYPSGGNYWSDYNGTDLYSGLGQNVTGGDGIGDTPYLIGSNRTDRFPLMAPFETFNVSWYDTFYSVNIVSNSSIDDFTLRAQNWPTLSFTVTGADGTTGFCRVAIPQTLTSSGILDDMWAVTVNGTLIKDRTVVSDAFYTYIYFTYHQSTETVQITIPEFQLLLIPFLFMAATLAATVARRKKPGADSKPKIQMTRKRAPREK